MAKHSKEKKNKIIYTVLIFIFSIIAIYSLYKIGKWYLNIRKNRIIKKEISETITVDENTENKNEKYKVDFEKLKIQNNDTVAWIKVNGTEIEYPVVKGNDNDYYLRHNFNKEYNIAGWAFADYKNEFNGRDKNIIVYGHNMKDGSMFASLKNVIKEEWYSKEENLNIIFATESETSIYRVFSTYQIENEEYYITTRFNKEEEFKEFIDTIKGRSVNDFNIEVTTDDQILTLSTCANNNNYRIVLHAKKMK